MNRLLGACQLLYERFDDAVHFADVLSEPLPTDPGFAQELEEALTVCDRHGDELMMLCCLLIADVNGLLVDRQPHAVTLARLALNFGLYERALAVCRKVEQRTTDTLGREIHLVVAKAHRGLGDYEAAQDVYRTLLRSPEIDALWSARILLNLAKLAHNFQWRVGYYREMVHAARRRLEELASGSSGDNPAVLHWLGICYDSIAWLDAHPEGPNAAEGKHAEQVRSAVRLLESAVELGVRTLRHNSTLRRKLRLLYLRFGMASTDTERRELIGEFQDLVSDVGTGASDPRGLGVRHGQLGEMQMQVGELEQARDSLYLSLQFARRVSDFRTLAGSNLRLARLACAKAEQRGEFEQHISMARRAVEELRGQHPEIELQIEREQSTQFSRWGDYERSLSSMRSAAAVLNRLERRVQEDLTRHLQSEYQPEERRILSSEEWLRLTTSLLTDYRLLARHQRTSLEEMARLAERGARERNVQMQLDFLLDYQRGWHHRLKNLMLLSNDRVSVAMSAVVAHAPSLAEPIGFWMDTMKDVRMWTEETQRDIFLLQRTKQAFVNVRAVAESLRMPAELSVDHYLRIDIEPKQAATADFYLMCQAPLLEQALMHLVENAARMVRTIGPAEHRVTLRVNTGTDQYGAQIGIIEVEDTAGRAERLRTALAPIEGLEQSGQALPENVSGLYLAYRFFRRFKATASVERRGGLTVLRFEFPHDRASTLVQPIESARPGC